MAADASPVARARELDAAGRHDDAINELAVAAQRGDVEATTQLAKRLIVGDRAPPMRREGIGLLRDAMNMGGAEAADRYAVILVTGVEGPADWRAAIRLLAVAAERGFEPSRAQLQVLASMIGHDVQVARSNAAETANTLVADANLERLLVPAAGSLVCAEPRICTFPKFVSAPVCAWLVERSRGRLERAKVYDAVKQTDFVDESRTNSAAIFHFMDADLVHLLVQARMAIACGQPITHMEAPTVLHYSPGETIGHHYDFVDPEHSSYDEEIRRAGNRAVTFLIYLNDDYDGGETTFPKVDIRHRGQPGEGFFWVNTLADGRANVQTLHTGEPPTRGEKWVFSQFVRNRPQL